MNRITKFSIVLLSVLLSSIIIADLSKGVLISDQLEIQNGSYVEGKVFYSDGMVTDELFSNTTIKVEDIFNTTDTNEKLIQISVNQVIQPDFYTYYPSFLENQTNFEVTHLVFYDNRTTFLTYARLLVGNSTDSMEFSLLGYTKISEMLDINNTRITFANGTTFTWGSASPAVYSSMAGYVGFFQGFGLFLTIEYEWTLLGISPFANVGDTVNYNIIKGDVVAKPPVTSSLGKSYDTIQVKYVGTSLFGWMDFPEVNAYYDIETGFLIKLVEGTGSNKFEFVPGKIKFGSGLPFPTAGLILGLATIGLIAYFNKKKR